LDAGEADAIVLARAGLVRLGLEARATQVIPVDVSLPAPGQGALAVECRAADDDVRAALARVHDPRAAVAVAAERGVLAALGGDCRTPLGAWGEWVNDSLRLRAFVARSDGSESRSGERTVPRPATEVEAFAVGMELGRSLG
ncbi:MAG: hydroxymethylbilane synthase, partial [Myxococcales bacterium]|nr:hydroxymethylbilane synthase [Myxococcales bacterium]